MANQANQTDDAKEIQPKLRIFLRRRQVEEVTGLRTATIYELMQSGQFPRPIQLSKRLVAWDQDDVAAWQAARIAESAAQTKSRPATKKK